MKVYVIIGDNGEMYEDYYTWIECVCATMEVAKKRKKELDKRAKKSYKSGEVWSLGHYEIKEFDVLEVI